jgi:oxygen-independent coproporphyrinogen-3 oxidase
MDDAIELTDLGWYGVRAIAMVFDRHLHEAASPAGFSRIA